MGKLLKVLLLRSSQNAPWAFLPLRHFASPSYPRPNTFRHFSTIFDGHAHRTLYPGVPFDVQLRNLTRPSDSLARHFSSEAAIEVGDSDHAFVADVFVKFGESTDFVKEMELNNVSFSHDLILKVLDSLRASPDVARKFFNWVSESHSERLSSKSYNLMLGTLGSNGFVAEFWGLFEIMKTKGYGVSKRVRDKVLEAFEKGGRESDVEKLKHVFDSGSVVNSVKHDCSRICAIVKNEVWSEDLEKKLREINVEFSGSLVKKILENLALEPRKALIFFRWVLESGFFKHNEQTYNAMAVVLGREDCIDRFWKLVDEMKVAGYEMERETFVKVLGRFCRRKMIKEAVYLYEYAVSSNSKLTMQDCTFLLRKVASSKDFDLNLFSRVMKAYTEKGNAPTGYMLNAVLKSLVSVGRLGESSKVLKVMKGSGLLPVASVESKIAFQLSSTGKVDEASEFMNAVEASGDEPDFKTQGSLVKGHCVAGNLEKAVACFQEMVKKDVETAGGAFNSLVNAYCSRNKAIDACKFLKDFASDHQLKPWHGTYKLLIKNLLVQGKFKEALSLLGLMKDHGYPPPHNLFIEHISKKGTKDDALALFASMTSKRFPSTAVFLEMFEAFFKVRRHKEAQELLSECPSHIRSNADILNLFCLKSKGTVATLSA